MKGESLGNSAGLSVYDLLSNIDEQDEQQYIHEIKDLAEIEKMQTIDQLSYLLSTLEAAEADAYLLYLGGADNIFQNISTNNRFPPLVRVVARIGHNLKEDINNNDTDGYDMESLGYSTIASPEMLPLEVLSRDQESMSRNEIETKLAALDMMPPKLGLIEVGSPEDSELWQHETLRNKLELALQKRVFLDNQSKLHQEFPALPKEGQIVKIASDAAAMVKFTKKYDDDTALFSLSSYFSEICDQNGNRILVPQSNDEDPSLMYLAMIHNNLPIKNEVEKILSLNLSEISLISQIHLLKFMAEADDGRFDTLCDTLGAINSKALRRKLLENFVAADFGEDFGDALLNIAGSERLNDREKEEVLDTISSCRESIGKIAGLYSEFDDGRFAKEYARAANERLTDAVTVFERIAKNGSVEVDLGWPGKTKYDYKSALEALQYEAKTLAMISGVMEDVGKRKDGAFAEIVLHSDENNARTNRTLYDFHSPEHGYVLLYTRPEGSHSFDPIMEYGKIRSRYDETGSNAGVEASISFIANPVDPFSLPNPYKPNQMDAKNPHYYDSSTMDKVSGIRLDREGRAPGMKADDPNRDSVNPVGMISVDLAAIGDRSDTPSGKIARLFAAGNALRATKGSDDLSMNHNTKWFDQKKYGTEEGFSELVNYIDNKMSGLTKSCPPRPGEGYTAIMRQAQRSRGNKSLAAKTQNID